MLKRIIVAIAVVGLALAPAIYPTVTQATNNNSGSTCSGSALNIPVDSWDTGKKGQEKVLAIKDIENGEYELTVVSKNQESVHPNTDMIVRSGDDQVEVKDVESEAFKSGKAEGTLEIKNGKVTLLVRIGKDGVYSGGMDVCLHKVKKPVEKCPIPGKEELPKDSKDCKEDKENCPIPGKEDMPKDSDECKEDVENCPVPGKEDMPKDSENCEETPETPKTPETPEQPKEDQPAELPQTGLDSPIVSAAMLGVLAYLSYTAVRSFRG